MNIIDHYALGRQTNFFNGLRHDSKSRRATRLIYVITSLKGRNNTLLVNAPFQFSHQRERDHHLTAKAKIL